jgi:hypothetical protein
MSLRDTTASRYPPISMAILSEPNIKQVLQDPNLRDDINFDPELHSRPKLDGHNGKKKKSSQTNLGIPCCDA